MTSQMCVPHSNLLYVMRPKTCTLCAADLERAGWKISGTGDSSYWTLCSQTSPSTSGGRQVSLEGPDRHLPPHSVAWNVREASGDAGGELHVCRSMHAGPGCTWEHTLMGDALTKRAEQIRLEGVKSVLRIRCTQHRGVPHLVCDEQECAACVVQDAAKLFAQAYALLFFEKDVSFADASTVSLVRLQILQWLSKHEQVL